MDISEALSIWKTVIFNPNRQTFETQMAKANLTTAWWWMASAGLLGAIMRSIVIFLMASLFSIPVDHLISELVETDMYTGFRVALIGLTVLFTAIFTPFSLLMFSGFLFVLAKLVGGQGNFDSQTYLLATFTAPFWFIGYAIGGIPIVGWLVIIGLMIFQFFLSYYVIQASHQLDKEKARIVILIPAAIFLLYGAASLITALIF